MQFSDLLVMPSDPALTESKEANENGVYIIECSVSGGKPPPIFTWYLLGTPP